MLQYICFVQYQDSTGAIFYRDVESDSRAPHLPKGKTAAIRAFEYDSCVVAISLKVALPHLPSSEPPSQDLRPHSVSTDCLLGRVVDRMRCVASRGRQRRGTQPMILLGQSCVSGMKFGLWSRLSGERLAEL